MNYNDLIAWTKNKKTMYLITKGEINTVTFDEYCSIPLKELPSDARITSDAARASIISASQLKQGLTQT